jgi:hypothetical protein
MQFRIVLLPRDRNWLRPAEHETSSRYPMTETDPASKKAGFRKTYDNVQNNYHVYDRWILSTLAYPVSLSSLILGQVDRKGRQISEAVVQQRR